VTLRLTRTWKEGDEKFTAIHQGLTYHLLGQNELTSFREQPEKFVPRLLGCDPVALTENDLAIPGSTKFGAFYDGNLFLFENADARSKFKKNPQKYIRVRHVLKPEDILSGVRLTSRD
jgi:YHS domain-containing protein